MVGDKGYDSDALAAEVESRGAEAVIPSQVNRTEPRELDGYTDRERNLAERFWTEVKQFRRVATRYEKKPARLLAFAWLAAAMVMLK